jgi:hypothetical protein
VLLGEVTDGTELLLVKDLADGVLREQKKSGYELDFESGRKERT